MNKEEFKDIPGYEGLYQVSNTGKVLSLTRNKIRKPGVGTTGYRFVDLYKNNISKTLLIHRLVMLTFVGPSNLDVNHKDGDKSNNNLYNLEYMTAKENNRHAFDIGLKTGIKGEENHYAKLTEKEVLKIRKLHKNDYSQTYIANIFDVDQSTISNIVHNKTWRHI